MFKDKNLLVLSHTYNSFIKDPVEILAKQFNKVYVLVRYQPVAELSNYIPLSFFRSRAKYSKEHSIDLTNKPKNVEVILVPLWYSPFSRFYYSVGKKHANAVLRIIKKFNINIQKKYMQGIGYRFLDVLLLMEIKIIQYCTLRSLCHILCYSQINLKLFQSY